MLSPTNHADICAAQVARLCKRKYGLLVGSGTTALTLACSMVPAGRKKVIIPAISCISVLYSVLFAGCEPIFVDINPDTGLIDLESARKVINQDPLIGALIVVHTYGYAVNFQSIMKVAREKGVLIIEDAAQAHGGSHVDGQPLGALGDLSLVSFGHTKVLDLGGGGVLMTDSYQIYSACRSLADNLPVTPQNLCDLSEEYRANYYSNWELRNGDPLALRRIGKFYLSFREMFLHRSEDETARRISAALPSLGAEVSSRRALATYYKTCLINVPGIRFCNTSNGSVPWRFIFLVPDRERDTLLDYLRKSGIDASSWYPSLACFHERGERANKLPNAEAFERQVINLWLTSGYNKKLIETTCSLIQEYLGNQRFAQYRKRPHVKQFFRRPITKN